MWKLASASIDDAVEPPFHRPDSAGENNAPSAQFLLVMDIFKYGI